MKPIVELIEVSKHFRTNWTFQKIRAVDGLSVSISAGEVFGLIGHNGAGKTTTFKVLVGLLRPNHGTLLWDGVRLDWRRPRESIGFTPEEPYFYDYLSVRETLDFYGQLYGLTAAERQQRIGQLAAELQLDHKMDAPVRTLSKGTLQRVAIAQAIMHRPRLVILDEPMSGLDPAGRKHVRDRILQLKRDGTTVLFSSHILTDAETLCDRVAILAAGKLREIVELGQGATSPTAYTLIYVGAAGRALETLTRVAAGPPLGGPDRWTITCRDRAAVRAALAALQDTDAYVEAIVPERPSLEERFFYHVADGSSAD